MAPKRQAAIVILLAGGLALPLAGCAPRPTAPPPASDVAAGPEVTPEIRSAVEQRCDPLIRSQLVEPDKVQPISINHRVDPGNRHYIRYCLRAGDGGGGFVKVEALCFYNMSGKIVGSPTVNNDPSIVDAICNR
jgi:hypothetical protein